MPSGRQKRLMQEALDDGLPVEARQQLYQKLDETPEDAEVFSRLKQVDRLLRTAPMERAPERLALKILARLAEGLQTQPMSQTAGMALALALALMALLLMPVLAAVGTMILNTVGSASAMSSVLEMLSTLLLSLTQGLETLVNSAQQIVEQYPQTTALLVLIPLAIVWLVRSLGAAQSPGDEA